MNTSSHQEFKGHEFNGESITIRPDDIFLKCEFLDCHIVLDMHRGNPGIFDSQVVNCLIEAKRTLMNGRFFRSRYVDCRFKGRFGSVDFGRSPWADPLGNEDHLGELRDCDFSAATLNLCRFFHVEISRQRFASWPQFVIPFDRDLAASQRSPVWPGGFSDYFKITRHQDLALSALAGTAAYFKKHYVLTENELLQVLDDIGGVIR
uniref:hypothetical protein n=1 Tax=unclassified Variovorax TaxID=663243 RepID=UPI00104D40AE